MRVKRRGKRVRVAIKIATRFKFVGTKKIILRKSYHILLTLVYFSYVKKDSFP